MGNSLASLSFKIIKVKTKQNKLAKPQFHKKVWKCFRFRKKPTLKWQTSHLRLRTTEKHAGSKYASAARQRSPWEKGVDAHTQFACSSSLPRRKVSDKARVQKRRVPALRSCRRAKRGRAQLANNSGETKQRSKFFWRSEASYQLDNDCPNTHLAWPQTKTRLFHQKFVISEQPLFRILMSCCVGHILTSFQYWKLSNLVQRGPLCCQALITQPSACFYDNGKRWHRGAKKGRWQTRLENLTLDATSLYWFKLPTQREGKCSPGE